MKKNMFRLLLAFTLFAGFSNVTNAQVIYVKVQPIDPVVTVPPQPSPRHVWIGGEYVVRGGSYVWQPGYWSLPPHGRRAWVRGHWATGPRGGYYWVAGHWI